MAIREDRWEGLTSAMALGDVLEVADDLRDLRKEHACAPLVEYAGQLREHAQNFEQTKLEKALAGFDRLIRSIGAETA
ncbi:MAG: hypothetical protein WD342_20730 [Verrucomicrobiales bacterium]